MNIFPEKSIKLLQTDKSQACVNIIRKAASLSKFPKVSEHERKLQTSFKIVANAGFLFGEALFAPIQQILVPCTIFTTSSEGERLKMISGCICLHLSFFVVKCLDQAVEERCFEKEICLHLTLCCHDSGLHPYN